MQVSPHYARVRVVRDRPQPILPLFHLRPRRSIVIETQQDLRVIHIVSSIDQTNCVNIEIRNETSNIAILSKDAEVRYLRDFLLTSYTDWPFADTFPPNNQQRQGSPIRHELRQTPSYDYWCMLHFH